MKTTTYLFILALCFCLVLPTQAQETVHGVRAGYVNSGLFVDGDQVSGSSSGFYAGFYRTTPIGSGFFQWYKGTEYTQAGAQLNDDTYQRLHYIQLPTGLRAQAGPVFAQVGIAVAFKVGETIQLDGQDSKTSDNNSEWYDFPWHTGVGVILGPATIEARYHWGLNDINDEGGWRNQIFQIGVGFGF